MARVRLLFDEDTQCLLAATLRNGGHDVVHVTETGLAAAPDPRVLAHAVSQKRVVFTHNACDYVPLARLYASQGRTHCGILVTGQAPFGELRQRLLRFLREHKAEEMRDLVLWLP